MKKLKPGGVENISPTVREGSHKTPFFRHLLRIMEEAPVPLTVGSSVFHAYPTPSSMFFYSSLIRGYVNTRVYWTGYEMARLLRGKLTLKVAEARHELSHFRLAVASHLHTHVGRRCRRVRGGHFCHACIKYVIT